MRGVDIEEAAAIGAELLDCLLAGDRAKRDGLLRAFDRGRRDGSVKRLREAHGNEGERHEDRERQKHVERRASQIDPEITDRLCAGARKGARERQRHGNACGGGNEVLYGQPRHLAEMAHRCFTAIGLPVGVGDEAHRCVEGEVRRNVGKALRIER